VVGRFCDRLRQSLIEIGLEMRSPVRAHHALDPPKLIFYTVRNTQVASEINVD